MANGMGGLYIGASGLQSSQNAINTTANNLTNVDTKGYVREQVIFQDMNYSTLSTARKAMASDQSVNMKQSGLGVSVGDVAHSRDLFLDKYYRTESGRQAFYSTSYDTIEEIQEQLQEMEGKAFQDVLSDLYVAFSEYGKDPASAVNQNLVVQKATLFMERSQALYKSLAEYQGNMNKQIVDSTTKVNALGKRISELNEQIRVVEAGKMETAMALRDERDVALDDLAKLGNISFSETADGVVKVKFEGYDFIDELSCHEMSTYKQEATGFMVPIWKEVSDLASNSVVEVFDFSSDISTEMNTDVGKLKSLVMNRGTEVSDYLDILNLSPEVYHDTTGLSAMQMVEAQLDQLVHGIVTTVNQIFSPLKTQDIVIGGTSQRVQVWDQANASLGSDKKGPGQELFSRNFVERYRQVTDDSGNTWYVYNEEDPASNTSLYTINNIQTNPVLVEDETMLPYLKSDGEVNYDMAKQISAVWDEKTMRLTPDAADLCSFKEYYERMVGNLGTYGNVYNSISSTLTSSVSSIETKRQQVIGVSSDEELSSMIKYQNAYNAASRYINVVDSMIEHMVTQLGS